MYARVPHVCSRAGHSGERSVPVRCQVRGPFRRRPVTTTLVHHHTCPHLSTPSHTCTHLPTPPHTCPHLSTSARTCPFPLAPLKSNPAPPPPLIPYLPLAGVYRVLAYILGQCTVVSGPNTNCKATVLANVNAFLSAELCYDGRY